MTQTITFSKLIVIVSYYDEIKTKSTVPLFERCNGGEINAVCWQTIPHIYNAGTEE